MGEEKKEREGRTSPLKPAFDIEPDYHLPDETVLVEITNSELELLNNFRAQFSIPEKGVNYTPRYLESVIETPSEKIIITTPKDQTKVRKYKKTTNPSKKSFYKASDGRNRLEIYTYREKCREVFFVSLNGETIALPPDEWRRIHRGNNKLGNFYGFLGKKKPLNKVKF